MDEVSVIAPATVSNVVCGFDCLGFALDGPFDQMTVRRTVERSVRIKHLDSLGLPTDPTANVAGVVLQAVLKAADVDFGFEADITKHIRPGSGIGSSAASAAGAAVAANRLIGDRYSKAELLGFAMVGEELASGSRHADNLAPCIFGGFTLVRSTDPLDIVELGSPDLYASVVHPHLVIRTAEARAMLPREVPLSSAVKNWSNLGAFVAGLSKGDIGLLSRSMKDEIVEPVRSKLIAGFDEAKSAGLAAGAFGGGISGSGPSMFMLSETRQQAERACAAMAEVFSGVSIDADVYVSPIAPAGVRFV